MAWLIEYSGLISAIFVAGAALFGAFKWVSKADASRDYIEKLFEGLSEQLGLLRRDVTNLDGKVNNLDDQVRPLAGLPDKVAHLSQQNEALRRDVTNLQDEIKPLAALPGKVENLSDKVVHLGEQNAELRREMSDQRQDMRHMKEDIREIRKATKNLDGRLATFETGDENADVLDHGSPRYLAKFGREISAKFGAREWAKREAPLLVDRVKDLTPYRILVAAAMYVKSEAKPCEPMLEEVENFAYEHGMGVHQVENVFVYELRDELFRLTGRDVPGEGKKDAA